MPTKVNKPVDLPALTGLRGVMALWVFLGHYSGFMHKLLGTPQWFTAVLGFGWVAVEVFFILSGFIMAHTHPHGAQTVPEYLRFLRKRLARIYPVYFVATLAFIAVIGANGWGHLPTLFDYARYVTLTQTWWNYNHHIWNDPSWSLSAEAGGYVLFPLLYPLVRRRVSLATLVGLAAAYAVFNMVLANPNMAMVVETGLLRSVPCFALGLMAYGLYRRTIWNNADAAQIANLAAIVVAILAVSSVFTTGRGAGWLTAIPAVAAVIALAYNQGIVAQMLSSRPLVFLGKISYSLYMTHWLVFQLQDKVFGLRNALLLPVDAQWAYFVGLILLAFGVGVATWRWVEIPCQKALR